MKFLFLALSVAALAGCATAEYQPGLRTPITSEGHHEGHFKGARKTNLFEQSWRPSKDVTKAVVIVVHGLKDHSSRYSEFAESLKNANYAVYAFDNRGHGDSEGQRVWVNSFSDYVTDLEIFYDLVKKAEPHQPIYLFGHSMGGAIVTEFVLKNKTDRPVSGIILSGPALKLTDDIGSFKVGSTKFINALFPDAAVLSLDDNAFSRDPKVVEDIKNDPLIYHGNGPARTARELIGAIDYLQLHMQEVDTSFLIVHGLKDALTNPDGSKEMQATAVAKDRTLKLYTDSYHDLLHEPEKKEVTKDILEWLESH